MKLKNLFTNLYWKKKYNSLVNEFESFIINHVKEKDQVIELQEKYIVLLETTKGYKEKIKDLKRKLSPKEKGG